MKNKFIKIYSFIIFFTISFHAQSTTHEIQGDLNRSVKPESATEDTLLLFTDLLNDFTLHSDNEYFKKHSQSILNIIESRSLSDYEISFLKQMYTAFSGINTAWNASKLSSYLARKRPFIISWISPADGAVSLAWLLLPENWNHQKPYSLYVILHGLYPPYSNPIEYMARYLKPDPIIDKTFEDGYSLFPWGRGNLWYEGISETDVWESIAELEEWLKVDQTKKYLVGHSMGGYGAWAIGYKSPHTWAALGIYAGALGYGGSKLLNSSTAEMLKDIPVYFVCGDQDGLLSYNQSAYQLLQNAGNTNITFTTFNGGHESLLESWQNMYLWIKNFSNENPTNIKMDNRISHLKLLQNYPNPFNSETIINYQIPEYSYVELKVFNILGSEVFSLVEENLNAGDYEVKFDGSSLVSGIYFYKLRVGNYQITKSMILLK